MHSSKKKAPGAEKKHDKHNQGKQETAEDLLA